nr:hypothetical protein 15 [bacterium]
MNIPSNNGEKPIKRDEKGRILKGSAALNPAGKNAGVRHKASIVKQAFFDVFQRLGGPDELVRWANESKANKRDFYKMILTILPRELDVRSESEDLKLIIIRPEREVIEAGKTQAIDKEIITIESKKPKQGAER